MQHKGKTSEEKSTQIILLQSSIITSYAQIQSLHHGSFLAERVEDMLDIL